MVMITEKVGRAQKNFCFKLYYVSVFLFFASWVATPYTIDMMINSSNFHISYYYFILLFIPMLLFFIGIRSNMPLMFDWLGLYILCIPLCFLYVIFSILASYKTIAYPFNYFVSGWMGLCFVGTVIWRARCIDIKSVKRDLLRYYIDKDKNIYSPKPDKGGISSLYKKTKKDSVIGKIRYGSVMLVIYTSPILIGANVSSAGNNNITLLATGVSLYLISMSGGIYMFLLYYTRLKCLYQIQKELGKKLRFY